MECTTVFDLGSACFILFLFFSQLRILLGFWEMARLCKSWLSRLRMFLVPCFFVPICALLLITFWIGSRLREEIKLQSVHLSQAFIHAFKPSKISHAVEEIGSSPLPFSGGSQSVVPELAVAEWTSIKGRVITSPVMSTPYFSDSLNMLSNIAKETAYIIKIMDYEMGDHPGLSRYAHYNHMNS